MPIVREKIGLPIVGILKHSKRKGSVGAPVLQLQFRHRPLLLSYFTTAQVLIRARGVSVIHLQLHSGASGLCLSLGDKHFDTELMSWLMNTCSSAC